MTDQQAAWSELEKAALSHAWDWFSVHAAQRLQVFNFFSVTTAFLVAAFVAASGDGAHGLAAAVASAGALASIGFNLTERRTRELVHAGEAAIAPLEARLARSLDMPALKIVDVVEHPKHGITKYSFVFNALQSSAAAAWLAASIIEWNRYW